MSLKAPLAVIVSACLAILTHSNAAHSAALPSVYDWITKDVCADASNQPVAADPSSAQKPPSWGDADGRPPAAQKGPPLKPQRPAF